MSGLLTTMALPQMEHKIFPKGNKFSTKIPQFLCKWKAQTCTGTLFENRCRYKKTVPQLLIRWSFQKDYITIPKSSKPERIQENANIFDFTISDEDMKTLVGFTQNNCDYRQQASSFVL